MSRFQKNIGQAGCQTLNTKSFFMERDDQELSMDKKGIKCDLWLKKEEAKNPSTITLTVKCYLRFEGC
jgi:hypothetical protein